MEGGRGVGVLQGVRFVSPQRERESSHEFAEAASGCPSESSGVADCAHEAGSGANVTGDKRPSGDFVALTWNLLVLNKQTSHHR